MMLRLNSLKLVCLLMATCLVPDGLAQEKPPAVLDQTRTAFPDSVIGRRGKEFMAAYNSGSKSKIKKYLTTHMSKTTLQKQPLPSLVAGFASIYEQIGELEVFALEAKSEFAGTIKTKSEKTNMWIDINFSVEEKDPYRQRNLGITPGRPPQANNYEKWDRLPDLLNQLQKETQAPSIAMAIIRNGEIAVDAIVGVRKLGESQMANISDPYHIGSVGKSITAVLIAKLIEDGEISWQTTIAEALPDVAMRDEYRKVTVRQLLNHQGGTRAFVDDRNFDRQKYIDDSLSPSEQRLALAKDALMLEPVSKPGTEMSYSNAGYIILGVMVEEITATNFEALMSQHVFEAIDLKSGGFGWPSESKTGKGPAGHFNIGGKIRPQKDGEANMGHFLVPAGDMYFSIRDVAKYAQFHLSGLKGDDGLISSNTLKELHQPAKGQNYAAGWVIGKAPDGTRLHYHNGSLASFYAAIFLYPDHDAAIVVATNIGMAIEPDILKAVEQVFKKEIQ